MGAHPRQLPGAALAGGGTAPDADSEDRYRLYKERWSDRLDTPGRETVAELYTAREYAGSGRDYRRHTPDRIERGDAGIRRHRHRSGAGGVSGLALISIYHENCSCSPDD